MRLEPKWKTFWDSNTFIRFIRTVPGFDAKLKSESHLGISDWGVFMTNYKHNLRGFFDLCATNQNCWCVLKPWKINNAQKDFFNAPRIPVFILKNATLYGFKEKKNSAARCLLTKWLIKGHQVKGGHFRKIKVFLEHPMQQTFWPFLFYQGFSEMNNRQIYI